MFEEQFKETPPMCIFLAKPKGSVGVRGILLHGHPGAKFQIKLGSTVQEECLDSSTKYVAFERNWSGYVLQIKCVRKTKGAPIMKPEIVTV